MTKKEAREIIEKHGKNTAFYGENNTYPLSLDGRNFCTYDFLYDMFRGRFGMGKAETLCLISALKLSGAVIEGELTLDY